MGYREENSYLIEAVLLTGTAPCVYFGLRPSGPIGEDYVLNEHFGAAGVSGGGGVAGGLGYVWACGLEREVSWLDC